MQRDISVKPTQIILQIEQNLIFENLHASFKWNMHSSDEELIIQKCSLSGTQPQPSNSVLFLASSRPSEYHKRHKMHAESWHNNVLAIMDMAKQTNEYIR